LKKPIPFAISRSTAAQDGEFVYVNSISTAEVYTLDVSGKSFPLPSDRQPNAISLTTPTNPRPGYIIGLERGDAIVTSYRPQPFLLYTTSTGRVEVIDLKDLVMYNAHLAMCLHKSAGKAGEQGLYDLKMLSSSNDFHTHYQYVPENLQPPSQPDAISEYIGANVTGAADRRCSEAREQATCEEKGCKWHGLDVDARTPCHATLEYGGYMTYVAPTQNSYLHRVLCNAGSRLTMATELRANKLMVVYETDLDMPVFDITIGTPPVPENPYTLSWPSPMRT